MFNLFKRSKKKEELKPKPVPELNEDEDFLSDTEKNLEVRIIFVPKKDLKKYGAGRGSMAKYVARTNTIYCANIYGWSYNIEVQALGHEICHALGMKH